MRQLQKLGPLDIYAIFAGSCFSLLNHIYMKHGALAVFQVDWKNACLSFREASSSSCMAKLAEAWYRTLPKRRYDLSKDKRLSIPPPALLPPLEHQRPTPTVSLSCVARRLVQRRALFESDEHVQAWMYRCRTEMPIDLYISTNMDINVALGYLYDHGGLRSVDWSKVPALTHESAALLARPSEWIALLPRRAAVGPASNTRSKSGLSA
jgi:hypothetical protein